MIQKGYMGVFNKLLFQLEGTEIGFGIRFFIQPLPSLSNSMSLSLLGQNRGHKKSLGRKACKDWTRIETLWLVVAARLDISTHNNRNCISFPLFSSSISVSYIRFHWLLSSSTALAWSDLFPLISFALALSITRSRRMESRSPWIEAPFPSFFSFSFPSPRQFDNGSTRMKIGKTWLP